VDQGFIALWMARHTYGGPLAYSGFDGRGLQVRDVLHVADLCALIAEQVAAPQRHAGPACNVGGGAGNSVSLAELTALAGEITGTTTTIAADPATRAADIPYYVSDCTALDSRTAWRPCRRIGHILEDVHRWLVEQRTQLEPLLSQ
jgi:CDP-paratose 2-epimerase